MDEVTDGSFWAFLVPVDHKGPELVGEFDLARLPGVRPGTVFHLYVHRRGRKFRGVLRVRKVRPREFRGLDGWLARAWEAWLRAHVETERLGSIT